MGPHTADVTPSGVNTVGFSFEIFILFSYRITVPGTCIVEIRVASALAGMLDTIHGETYSIAYLI